MTAGGGKRAGTRRGVRTQTLQPMAFVLALCITGSAIAWGYLVYLAIRHGQAIRSGDGDAWLPGAASGLGAVACLFIGFVLVARLLRLLATPSTRSSPAPATPGGGHRVRNDDG